MLSWIPAWTKEGGAVAIQKAARLGFDLLEISLPEDLNMDVPALREQLLTAGIEARFSVLLPASCHLPLYPEKALSHLKAAIGLVSRAGGNFLGGVFYGSIGVFSGAARTPRETETITGVLREAASFATDGGVTLALEPVNRYESYLVTSAAEAPEFIAEVASPALGLMLDTFHMNIEESNFYDPVLAGGARLQYVHLSGSDRGLPGEDHIPWDEFFRGLADIGYQGDVVLESFTSQAEGLAEKTSLWRRSPYPPDELAAASLRFMRQKARHCGLH